MSDEQTPLDWFPTFKQLRSRKINASDRCPCKSGKKFSACCALTPGRPLRVIGPMQRNQSDDTAASRRDPE